MMKIAWLTIVLTTAMLTVASGSAAQAQSAPQQTIPNAVPVPMKPPVPGAAVPSLIPLELGSSCQRKTDNRLGIVKKDACGRTYCGRTDIQDITEVRPTFASDNGCEWTLVAGHCKCQKIMSRPKQ